ncbi:MAG: hypothetical protein MAG431_01533 [Chloroflexi bacterium]|nr:hypothetical protein [Chloroflexota bacterium]
MATNTFPLFSDRYRIKRGALFGALIITALIAFEVFNYSSTNFALSDLLGELRFWGVGWATILAIAFCGIDFAGIARIFTPEQGEDEPVEIWYLFGAWLLAATMNAMLTWWGVSIAILNNHSLGNDVVTRETLLKVVPVFVAILVWLIRVLIIGTFSVAGDRLFSQAEDGVSSSARGEKHAPAPRAKPQSKKRRPTYRPAPKSKGRSRPEPTYEPIAARRQSSRSSRRF